MANSLHTDDFIKLNGISGMQSNPEYVHKLHYNEFMINVHKLIFELGKSGVKKEILKNVVLKNYSKTRVLFIDEFQVTDIADAMILKELISNVWNNKIFTIMTSNRHPSELYKNGLQRDLFMPFIKELEAKTVLMNFDGVQDHRRMKSGSVEFNWWMTYENMAIVED